MSVLFKALARAAKARDSTGGSPAPFGQPAIMAPRGRARGSSRKRTIALSGVLIVLAAGVGYMFIPDDEPPRTASVRPPPRQIVLPPPPGAAAPPAATTPVAPPAPTPVPPPASESAVVSAAPVVTPEAGPPQVELKPMPGSTPPEGTAAPQAAPAPARSAQPIQPADEDLPALLARLRRDKARSSASQAVTVARNGGARDLVDEDGNPSIKVGAAPGAAPDLARSAYDNLLQGRYEEALGGYERALAVEPRNVALLLGKATALQKLRRASEARSAYDKVLAIDPANREALTNMTSLVALQSPEQALADLQRLKKTHPDFSPIEAEIASQEMALGDVPSAVEALNRAVALTPDNGLYHLNLAIIQDRAGMAPEAIRSYQMALQLLSGGSSALPLPLDQVRRRLDYLQGR